MAVKKISDSFSDDRWKELRIATSYAISHGNGRVEITAPEVMALMDHAEEAEKTT